MSLYDKRVGGQMGWAGHAIDTMSFSIGPNGFHDGEAPEYNSSNDDDGDALSKLCDNPAYLVVGSDDDLIDNLPSWVEDLLTEHETLAAQAEKIGLEPSSYVTVPDRGSNSELGDFLGELGFTTDSSYIERGPGSSIDGVVYVRKSKIPALERQAERKLQRARKAIVKDGRRTLKPGPLKAADVHEELERLVSQAQLQDPEYRAKIDKIEDLERSSDNLLEVVQDREAEVARWKAQAEEATANLAGVNGLILHWVDQGRVQSDRYAAWTWAVEAEFGILIRGPLLKLADGRAFAVEKIFQIGLANGAPAVVAAIDAREPGVQWLTIDSRVRRGLYNGGPLIWSEAVEWSKRRLTWNQVWWVIFGFHLTGAQGHLFRLQPRAAPDTGNEEGPVLPKGYLGLSPEQQTRWDQLLKEYWGEGIYIPPRPTKR